MTPTDRDDAPIAVLLDTIWAAYKRRSCDKATAIGLMHYVVAAMEEVGASELLDDERAPSVRYGRVVTT